MFSLSRTSNLQDSIRLHLPAQTILMNFRRKSGSPLFLMPAVKLVVVCQVRSLALVTATLLKDPVRMNILEAAAKNACLPCLFPEHNMQPLAVKEYMLTEALNPPLDRPQLPAAMTSEQFRSSGKLASWTHHMTAQEEEEATELLLTVAMITGNDLHSCEVAAQMSCARALLFMHNFVCSGLTCHSQLQPHCSCAGDCSNVRTMLFKHQVTVHQTLVCQINATYICRIQPLSARVLHMCCRGGKALDVALSQQKSIEELMSSCQDMAYFFTSHLVQPAHVVGLDHGRKALFTAVVHNQQAADSLQGERPCGNSYDSLSWSCSRWQEAAGIKYRLHKTELWISRKPDLNAALLAIPTAKLASSAQFLHHVCHMMQHTAAAQTHFGDRRHRQLCWRSFVKQ